MKQSESTNSIGFLKISQTSAVSGPFVRLKTFSWLQFGKKTPTPDKPQGAKGETQRCAK